MKSVSQMVCACCNQVIDFTKVSGYYRIKDKDYCLECGRNHNETHRDELLRDMHNELYFGTEM